MKFPVYIPPDNPDQFEARIDVGQVSESCLKDVEDSTPDGYTATKVKRQGSLVRILFKKKG